MDNFDFVNLSSTFGLIATGFFTANLLLGVLLSTKYQRTLTWQRLPRFVRRVSLYQVHNYTAYIALLTAFTHPVLLLFGKKAGFRLLNIAVPLTAPHQSYIYTLGAIAFYGLLTAVVTSTVFVRKLFTHRTWKLIHFTSYGAAMLFLIHGLWADPLLLDRPVNLVDAEKVLSEAGIVLLVIIVVFRLRYAKQKRESETFYPLKLSKIIRETDLADSFILEVPENLKKQFKYRSGQFITLRVQDGDSFVKRSYSMTSAPETDSFLSITIKRLGRISNYLLDTVKEGDTLMVLPSEGSFFQKPTRKPTHYLFFAAGSGITPFLSMTKSLLKTRPHSQITLIYANANENSIIFKNELERLARENPKKISVIHVLESPEENWTACRGMLAAHTLDELLDEFLNNRSENTEYYICGPVGYINLVESVLLSRKIHAEKIHAEKFTFAPQTDVLDGDEKPETALRVGAGDDAKNGSPQKLTIQLKGDFREIDYRNGETILDAALRAGLLPPFACQEGVCASCKVTVVSGRVVMLNHEALTPLEADQRNILTCTAAAISDETVVSFDE
ncbi:MAG: 2Fe-2S iron-sulfur cluster-binding protein [Pyrinomonadaceae bacterium]